MTTKVGNMRVLVSGTILQKNAAPVTIDTELGTLTITPEAPTGRTGGSPAAMIVDLPEGSTHPSVSGMGEPDGRNFETIVYRESVGINVWRINYTVLANF